ncbi:MAG: glycerophosphodiester phosphodiesterase [Victivallales bacterium]|nr:glycerophosphodiester phosphodiesterase [Victivallales bacterium]
MYKKLNLYVVCLAFVMMTACTATNLKNNAKTPCPVNSKKTGDVMQAKENCHKPVIIAHRGASGYLPEHTLEAVVMAYAMGADYIEQDVSMTKDGKIVVMHDIYLNSDTNVSKLYPKRCDKNGKYHISDFTLKEIKKLTVHERTDKNGKAVFSDRFPENDKLPLRVPTLIEEIILIQGLNKSTGNCRGLYVELKKPWVYPDHGKKFAKKVLSILNKYGYNNRSSKCYIQCFDPYALKYIKNKLHNQLKLIQLIGKNSWNETPGIDYNKMLTKNGIKKIAKYADGIGPDIDQLFTNYGKSSTLKPNNVTKWAHENGLLVHPYTLRKDSLPENLTYDSVCNALFKKAKVDGMFTDFTDLGVEYVNKNFN